MINELESSDEELGNSDEEELGNIEVEYILLNVESVPPFESIDITSSSMNRPEFPSEEFGSFMELISKWNLSDACANDILKFSRKICRDDVILPTSAKQGRQLLDQINIPHFSFNKVPIMIYKEDTYYLRHRQIFDAIKELLSNPNIFKNCVFEYKPLFHEGQRIYHEQYNGEWWERAQNSISSGAKVLSIILYSDATTCDLLGKSTEHPIYLTLGNIPSWIRNKPYAKILLGYLPQLNARTTTQKRSKSFILAKRALYQHALDILMRPLLDYNNDGFDLLTDDGELWCYPFISVMLGDLPEDAALTLTYNSPNCKYPCHTCFMEVDKLNDVTITNDQIVLRTPENMKDIVEQNLAHHYSLYSMKNIFWKYP